MVWTKLQQTVVNFPRTVQTDITHKTSHFITEIYSNFSETVRKLSNTSTNDKITAVFTHVALIKTHRISKASSKVMLLYVKSYLSCKTSFIFSFKASQSSISSKVSSDGWRPCGICWSAAEKTVRWSCKLQVVSQWRNANEVASRGKLEMARGRADLRRWKKLFYESMCWKVKRR